MIINKVKIADEFSFKFELVTHKDSHGKFSDKSTDIDQIIESNLAALKIQLSQYIKQIPDKVG